MAPRDDRVVIVGAGITGLAIAAALGPSHDVVVLERGSIAGDTTSRASGVISLPLEPIPPTWANVALEAFRSLDGRGTFSFVERPMVRLLPTNDDGRRADWGTAGGPFLSREELIERFPDTFDDLSAYDGGIVHRRTGYIDVLSYAMTLKWLAERSDVRIYRDHPVRGLRTDTGSVVGVDTAHGPIDAESVVVATGWRAREQLENHLQLPIRPLRWSAVVLEPTIPIPIPETFPMGSDPRTRTYGRPTDRGDVLVGGNEHLVESPDETPAIVEDDFRAVVRDGVAPMLRGVEAGSVRREDCCPSADTATPDGRPIVDAPPSGPAGLVVATGLHGRGIMLSPVVARAVRALLGDEPDPFPMAPLRLNRFADRSADFEYRSHWA